MLSNLREVYHEFIEKFPDRKIGFSKFTELSGPLRTGSMAFEAIMQQILN